jgi:hypothetical protein
LRMSKNRERKECLSEVSFILVFHFYRFSLYAFSKKKLMATNSGDDSMATAAIPFIQAGASILGKILGAAHAQAVATEAGDLNKAVPQYRSNLVAIIGAYNGGQVSASQALQAVDEAVTEYYSAVSGIIKDSSNQGAGCTTADANGQGTNCNGPCTVGCAWIVPWAKRVKLAIQQGGGTLSFDAIIAHAGFLGLPAWSITVSAPSVTTNVGLNVAAPSSAYTLLTPTGSVLQSITQGIVPASQGVSQQAVFTTAKPNQTPLLLFGAGALALLAFVFSSSPKKS